MVGSHYARCGKKFKNPEEDAIPTILAGESIVRMTCWDDRTCYSENMFHVEYISRKYRKAQKHANRFVCFQ